MAVICVAATCGIAGTLFHYVLHFAAESFFNNPKLIYLLAPAGILIVSLYKFFGVNTKYSTVNVIKAVRANETVPSGLSASIFSATFLTHIFGGSSGREGAALQLGGSIAGVLSSVKSFGFGYVDKSVLAICGMASTFSALFGTPLAAAVFVLTIINVKKLYLKAFVPCVLSSYLSYGIAYLLKNRGVRYTIYLSEYNSDIILKALLVALICAFISILFCYGLEYSKKLTVLIKNEYVRIVIGGIIILFLTLLVGTNDYNGAGADVIGRAIGGGVENEAFILKMLFTVITLSFGFKGGEIVPSFVIGATFGCLAGDILGGSSSLCAAVGMMSVFSGVTNCPIAAIIMAAEIFGFDHLLIFIPSCLIAFLFSGKHSLYGSRQFSPVKWFKQRLLTK